MDNGPDDLTDFVDAATTWRYWQRRAVTRSSEESKRRTRAHDNLLVAIDELFGDEDAGVPSSITCLTCGRQSFNPQDVKEGYCGHCHDWTSPPLARRPDALPADPS